MAGSASMLNPIHAGRDAVRPTLRQPALIEASLTMLGRTFTTTIREGTSTNDFIEKVARENGGEVTKKYYAELKTWEITSVRIGDVALVKSPDEGIHWSLGSSGIPIAVTKDQGIVFPNGDELRMGRSTPNIGLWTTSSPLNPESIRDLDRVYGQRGGVKASREALDEISRAHGGGRTGKLELENSILVLDKDTGEILTVSQHASKEPEPAAIAPDAIRLSLPNYASSSPATPEIRSFIPAQFDGFRDRLDMGRLVVRTFDGSIADFVRIQMNPFSQDKLDAGLSAMPKGQKMIPSPQSNAGPTAKSAPPVFCLLAFSSENKRDDPDAPPSSPPPTAPGVQVKTTKRLLWKGQEWTEQGASSSPPQFRTKGIPASVPIIYDLATKAWNERRLEPIRLEVPVGAIPVKGPKTWKPGRKKSHPRKTWPMEPMRHMLALAGVLSIIARLLKERAQKISEADKVKRASKVSKPVARKSRVLPGVAERKKPPLPARSISAEVKNARKERRRKDKHIGDTGGFIQQRAKSLIHINAKAPVISQSTLSSMRTKPANQTARPRRAPSGIIAAEPKSIRRKGSLIATKRRKTSLPSSCFYDLLGIFSGKRRKKITGRAWAGN